jgi:hypothetical protein
MICFNTDTIGQITQLFGLFNKKLTLSMTSNFNWLQQFVAFNINWKQLFVWIFKYIYRQLIGLNVGIENY